MNYEMFLDDLCSHMKRGEPVHLDSGLGALGIKGEAKEIVTEFYSSVDHLCRQHVNVYTDSRPSKLAFGIITFFGLTAGAASGYVLAGAPGAFFGLVVGTTPGAVFKKYAGRKRRKIVEAPEFGKQYEAIKKDAVKNLESCIS